MVEIKEEDLAVGKKGDHQEDCYIDEDCHYYLDIPDKLNKKEVEQLKQQILQDHEDAKLTDIMRKVYGDDVLHSWIKTLKNDRQIVKRLKERIREINQVTFSHGPVSNMNMITELQKILEGKK